MTEHCAAEHRALRNMRPFEFLIFDCDGVLVDSERIANRVLADMLRSLGLTITPEEMYERFVGHSWATCLYIIRDLLGRAVPAGFEAEYRARRTQALESWLTAVPGVAAALDRIALPCCVASNSERDVVRMTLDIAGLLPRFEGRLFGVNDVKRGKPAPDLYLHAAQAFGVEPSACVVVEDTPTGVTAGVAAGMTVYGYAALIRPARLLAAGASLTFDDMHELPALLAAP